MKPALISTKSQAEAVGPDGVRTHLAARIRRDHTESTEHQTLSALPVTIPKELLKEFCERNHIRKLSLFGSVLTPRFRPNSDLDILVEFDPGHVPGLITLAGMEIELSEKLGRKVDLRTAEDLSHYFRAAVVSSALPQYERP
jgi:uncharacterized protein